VTTIQPELTLDQRITLASEGMLTADYKRNATAREVARFVEIHYPTLPLVQQYGRDEIRYRTYQRLLVELVAQRTSLNGATA
jgi:hypothetical protein